MLLQLSKALVYADLLNVFETFLPQLLLYPNPTDPLNGEAAALLMREPEAYNAKVKGEVLLQADTALQKRENCSSAAEASSNQLSAYSTACSVQINPHHAEHGCVLNASGQQKLACSHVVKGFLAAAAFNYLRCGV